MEQKETNVINKSGLHARPASSFVKLAKQFRSDISIVSDGEKINAKSIVALLSAGLVCGKHIVISAEGEDEKEAVDALWQFVTSGCGEMLTNGQ